MKKIVLFIGLFVAGYLTAQQSQDKYPIMTFDQTHFDLGTLHEGDVVERTYHFTNTGDAPLVIKGIRASCGCTVPSGWKKEPIMPGETGSFKVRFNTRNKIHRQHKTITITCNTKKGRELVSFTANVIPDPEMEKRRAEQRKKWAEMRKKRMAEKKKIKQQQFALKPNQKSAQKNSLKQAVKPKPSLNHPVKEKMLKHAPDTDKNKTVAGNKSKHQKRIVRLQRKIAKKEKELKKLREKLAREQKM